MAVFTALVVRSVDTLVPAAAEAGQREAAAAPAH
jgi:hypothetical protein